MGCTEPIAIAYAAAKAREVLGCEPDLVKIGVSNNIIKNVKSVVVPNTDGMKGIEAAPWQASSAEMLPKSWKSSRRSQQTRKLPCGVSCPMFPSRWRP